MKILTEEETKLSAAMTSAFTEVDRIMGDIILQATGVFPSHHLAILVGAEAKKLTLMYDGIIALLPKKDIKSIELGVDIFVNMTSELSPDEASKRLLDNMHRMDGLEEERHEKADTDTDS